MEQVKYVCRRCGSDDVTQDAILRWDVFRQEWRVACELDNADCETCGSETVLIEVPA